MINSVDLLAQVRKSYAELKFEPRGTQESICVNVLDLFFNQGKQNVILDCPTGTGKSIIGAVVAHSIDALTPEDEDLGAIIAMGTNMLAHQYYDSFSSLDKHKVFQIKGAANYPCRFMEAQPSATSKTADDCAIKSLHELEVEKYCSDCEYRAAKKLVHTTSTLITNYAYYLTAAFISNHLKPRKTIVFDEAHLINDIFCNFTTIELSVDGLNRNIKELVDTGKCDNEAAALVMVKDKVAKQEIHDGNYLQVLDVVKKIYFSIDGILTNMASMLEKVDIVKTVKYEKMARKYAGLGGKIHDMVENNYEHVLDVGNENLVTVKTIFVGSMMKNLLAKYNLFMSATITEQFVYDTLELDRNDTAFLSGDPVFPRENKPILFIGRDALNYNNLKDPATITNLQKFISHIVAFHPQDKGLIIVPSFYLGNQLIKNIPRGTLVFEHRSGTNLVDIVRDFKLYKGSAVLVSPSIFEGVDFKYDHARYQIIVKAPYPSLGDRRIKHIANNYPNIYQEMTLVKIIQGAGRGVRSETDYCTTYCLDAAIERLWNNRMNIWKNQFEEKR